MTTVSDAMPAGIRLARVTFVGAGRRIDLALSDAIPLVALLPEVLRRLSPDAAETVEREGGWVTRRTDGRALDEEASLASQGVRDGEILHLVPARTAWPDPEVSDDIVEVMANAASRRPAWDRAATRRAGLIAGPAMVALAPGSVLLAGRHGDAGAASLLLLAALALAAAVALSRAWGDAMAGGAVAAGALPCLSIGAALITASHDTTGDAVAVGAAALVLASVVGYAASATLLSLFTAGVAVGLTALTGSLVALPKALDATDGAAVVVAAVLLLLPLYPAFAVRAGRVPVPEPARDPRELTEDPPDPAREEILAAVARAQDILLGLLIATGLTVVAGAAFLAAAQEPGTTVLAAVAALSVLLRGRTFSTAHERLPLFAGGVGAALAALAVVAFLARAQHASGQFAGLPAAGFAGLPAAGAALAVAVGLVYSRRGPSPTLSRYGAALDMVCLVALIPLAIVPLGLYGAVGRLAGASS